MANGVAPSCPINVSTAPTVRGKNPYSKISKLKDQVNSIPRAHDLPSVINALNVITNIITQITHNEPQVNNVYPLGKPSVILKGEDNNPNYQALDWVEEERVYTSQDAVNPDDNDQFITIKCIKSVMFYNPNSDYRLIYDAPED